MEYKRDNFIFHAHPNYNSFGKLYDRVMLDFAAPGDDQDYVHNAEGGYYDQSCYPAEILCY